MKKTVVVNGHHNRRQCFFCKNEYLSMKILTYVQQIEIKYTVDINGHPYEIMFFDNKCLYVEKTSYSK